MKFGKTPMFYCGGSQTKGMIPSCTSDKIKAKMLSDLADGKGLLWYNPGGNWGSLYRHVQLARFQVWELASKFEIPFISRPQSLHYDPPGEEDY